MKKSELIRRHIENFSKLEMSLLPTPLHRLNNLGSKLNADIYCKRDDLTAFAFGGNKTRKLDYLISHALENDYDSIVTFGAVQSNWCRMASTAGRAKGMDVYLILAGEKPEKSTANLLLDKITGADITIIDSTDRDLIIEETRKKALSLKKEGRNPYYLPVGGSVAIGSLGYINALAEIMQYSEENDLDFSDIVVASGSAGTQAGLIAGQIISGWKGKITGMSVSRPENEQKELIFDILVDTLDLIDFRYDKDKISSYIYVDDAYLGDGYRVNTKECLEAISEFACTEGIFLDEVYTGKAAAGLIDYAKKDRFSDSESVLFIHTGGNIQLFE